MGGRGTGKSTLLECLRYALDFPPKGKQAQKLHQDIIKENHWSISRSVELTEVSLLRTASSTPSPAVTASRRWCETWTTMSTLLLHAICCRASTSMARTRFTSWLKMKPAGCNCWIASFLKMGATRPRAQMCTGA
ncbi:hypothetical protein L0Z08_29365 [Burkholderia multivorans]|nr:hypothetical protein [Burkholderia multivorans]MCO1445306.1 hypothetical protein [Burkholderia multivorans]